MEGKTKKGKRKREMRKGKGREERKKKGRQGKRKIEKARTEFGKNLEN
jgi:hypothetical protein